ncbi:MAG: hypothetical protein J6Q22_19380 [Prevotella sp.]|nr:hypothetical protein [Prevotella sp.]
MRTLDIIKNIYCLHGKSIEWAVIEEVSNSETNLKPGIYIKGSRVYVDLYARRLFSTVELSEFARRIYVAKREKVDKDHIALITKEDSQKSIVLPRTFVADIYNVTIYGKWMEERLLL